MNLALNLSSNQSISLPMMLKRALLSIKTCTPSCCTLSSNAPALSTYSKWYAKPEHPLFFTPTRTSLDSGCSSNSLRCETAVAVIVMGAFLGRSFDFFAFAPAGCAVAVDVGFGCLIASASDRPADVGLLFCASPSLSLTFCSCCLCQGALGGHFCCTASLPEMLVSGIPAFRGGGGISEGKECGVKAEVVVNGRL